MIVDATFRYGADRRAFADAFGDGARDVLWIECRAPAETLVRRAAARERDPGRISDADAAIARRQMAEWEPLADVPDDLRVAIRTDSAPKAVVAAVAEALDARLRGSG